MYSIRRAGKARSACPPTRARSQQKHRTVLAAKTRLSWRRCSICEPDSDHMKRREFMTLAAGLAGLVATGPRPARSASVLQRVGVLMGVDGTDPAAQARIA